jgi:long-chain acyl-CoA synthetase
VTDRPDNDHETYPAWPNLAAMMFARARQWPDRPMLRAFHNEAWYSFTWGKFGRLAASVARGLRAAGVSGGDRVLIVSENRPEYPIAETALLAIGAIPVPTYVTNTIADHAHVLADSGARVAICSNPVLAHRVAGAGRLDLIVTLGDFTVHGERTLSWGTLARDDADFADMQAEAQAIPAGALACLIYTSGTGGVPKGVALPHRAILSNCRGAFELVRPLRLRNEVYLSFLPLSHSFEHTAGQFFLLSVGCEVAYSRGVEHLVTDMAAVRPTIMTIVPRVLEVIRSRILAQVARERPWRKTAVHRAVEIGRKRAEGERLTALEWLLDPLLERLVRRKVRARFGGRLRYAMSGGARLEPEVWRFFLGIGIELLQGYGQTEAGPVISATTVGASRVGTVGRVLQGVDLRIADDGEICVRGDLVMDGYWGRPAETAAVIRDGWLHTGDIGKLDADAFLTITDRKKDIIVLSSGENVSPARVEGLLVAQAAIAQAMVLGDGRPGLSALVVPAEGHDEIEVAAAISEVNKRLSVIERIRKHAVVPAFTIDDGTLTATQKIRRHIVMQQYKTVMATLLG